MTRRLRKLAYVLLALAAGPGAALAADPAGPSSAPETAPVRPATAPAAAPPVPAGPTVKVGPKGLAVSSADGAFVVKLRGYFQADLRFFPVKDEPGTTAFLIRRARPVLEATLFERFELRFMPDFGEGKATLQDVWVDARAWPFLRLRAGKYKSPFGLERLQSATAITFVERSLANGLVPNRDIGVMLHGAVGGEALAYAIGLFDGVADGASTDGDLDDDKELAARLFAHPFRPLGIAALEGLGLGVALSWGAPSGTPTATGLPSYKSPGQLAFFSYRTDGTATGTVVADGTRWRVSPQGYFHLGPFGLMGELVFSSSEIALDTERATLLHAGWHVAASFVIAGTAGYEGAAPARAVDAGGWGAVEIAARYSELRVDPDAFPTFADPAAAARLARAVEGAVIWYPGGRLELGVTFARTFFTGGATGGGDRSPETALLIRFQIAL